MHLLIASVLQTIALTAAASATDADSVEQATAAAYRMPVSTRIDAEVWQQWQQTAAQRLNQRPWLIDFRQASGPRPFLNRLIGETSPYLLQHAFQPVDWLGWHPVDDESTKLRLVSIGYSTCHWCHEMARRSFSDPAIAQLLNEAFVAIKVDREELPDVDRRYTDLQQRMTGSRGWPVTVIESARGEPVYVGSYLEPEQLRALLERLALLASTRPAALQALIDSQQRLLAGTARAQPAPAPGDVDAGSGHLADAGSDRDDAATMLAQHWDAKHGGLAGAQKFPNPPALEWLMQRDVISAPTVLRTAASTQLDAMLRGGLYDPRAGGFFRYSTRSDWSHPHFEKMLHTQAQLIRLYALAARQYQRPLWLQIARDTLRFTDDWLQDSGSGLYHAAVDAQHLGDEGGYYRIESGSEAATVSDIGFDLAASGSGHTVTVSQAQLQQRTRLSTDLAALRLRLPLPQARPFIDDKLLTGWNALQGMALLALARAEPGHDQNAELLVRATRIAERLWSRFDASTGRLARDQYGGAAAGAEDFAYLVTLQIDLYDHDPDRRWLERAAVLLERALADGHVSPRNAGDWHDAELPAPAPMLCSSADALLQRAYSETSQARAQRCRTLLRPTANAASTFPWLAPPPQESAGALSRVRYFADGHGRAVITQVKIGDDPAYAIDLRLDTGWHVNAAHILNPRLTPTRLAFDDGVHAEISYPAAESYNLGFSDEPLLLYQGEVRILVDVAARQQAELAVQACSDRVCLLPERLTFDIW